MRSSVLIPPPLRNVCVQCHPKAHFPEILLIVLHDHTTKQLFIFWEYAVQKCLCMWGPFSVAPFHMAESIQLFFIVEGKKK